MKRVWGLLAGCIVGGAVGGVLAIGWALLFATAPQPADWEHPHHEFALYGALVHFTKFSATSGALAGAGGAVVRWRVRGVVLAATAALAIYVVALAVMLYVTGFFA